MKIETTRNSVLPNVPILTEMEDIVTETRRWYAALDLPKSFSDVYGFAKIIQSFSGLIQSVFDSYNIEPPEIKYEVVDIEVPIRVLREKKSGGTIIVQIGSWLFKHKTLCEWYAPFAEMEMGDAILVVIAIMNGAIVHEMLHLLGSPYLYSANIRGELDDYKDSAPLVILGDIHMGLSSWADYIIKVIDDICMETHVISRFRDSRWWLFMPLVNRFFFPEESGAIATDALNKQDNLMSFVYALAHVRNFSAASQESFNNMARGSRGLKQIFGKALLEGKRHEACKALLGAYLPELFQKLPPPPPPSPSQEEKPGKNTQEKSGKSADNEETINKYPATGDELDSTHPRKPKKEKKERKSVADWQDSFAANVLEKIFPERDGKPAYGGWSKGAGRVRYFDSVKDFLADGGDSSVERIHKKRKHINVKDAYGRTVKAIDDAIDKTPLRNLFMERTMDIEKSQPCRTGISLIPQRIPRIVTDQKMFSPLPDELTERPSEVLILLDFSGSMAADVEKKFKFPSDAHYTTLIGAVSGVGYSLITGLARANVQTQLFAHTTKQYLIEDKENCVRRESCVVIKLCDTFSHRNNFVEISLGSMINTQNNQDHNAITECARHFVTDESGARTLVVLSDGWPTGAGYDGHGDALRKTRDAVNKLRERGITVYSLSLIDEVIRNNDKIYGEKWNIKLNATPLQSMLDELVRVIKKETERSANNVYTG